LPSYLETWKSLIGAVATVEGANDKYQLRSDELALIEQPLQFLWGENDPFGDLEVARQAIRLIPNAQLHEMQTGHVPFLDQPEACGAINREFLREPRQSRISEKTAVPVGR